MKFTQQFRRAFVILLLSAGSFSAFAQNCNDRVLPTSPNNRFELIEGEAKDLKTGLIWQRCSVGMTWDGFACVGEVNFYTWEQALSHANGQWRLPNIKELISILERACTARMINKSIFPDTASASLANFNDEYWSSSPSPPHGSGGQALTVSFYNGDIMSVYHHSSRYARLVRDGQ